MVQPRHSLVIRGSLPLPKPSTTREFHGTPTMNVDALKAWYDDYVADRRRRGIPEKGLRVPGGVRELDLARLQAQIEAEVRS